MNGGIDEGIRSAIAGRRILEFSYHGLQRLAEPYVYDIHNGKRQLLVFQVGGMSDSGDLPDWRRVNLDEVFSLQVTDMTFSPREAFSKGRYPQFDEVLARVVVAGSRAA